MTRQLRKPAVAGTFYPADPAELNAVLARLFKGEERKPPKRTPRALIVPHAAWRYSGTVAARAFLEIEGCAFRTVVLLGNAHTALFRGIALDPHDAWLTSVGTVPVDRAMCRRLSAMAPDLYRALDAAHCREHVLEVQLPMLRYVLRPGFTILPLLFGQNPPGIWQKTTDHLLSLISGDDLLVASSDLSHYPSREDARKIDHETMNHMASLDIEGLERHEAEVMRRRIPGVETAFCSPDAVKTVMEAGRRLGWLGEQIAGMNSGDIEEHDHDSVAGYGAVTFREP